MARVERDHGAALERERGSQMRGLLWIAAIALVFLLVRSAPLHLFHRGWWRM
jgi:hypothetical protein